MTKETDYIIQSMFDGENLEEITLDELRSHTDKYPYSSILQFLYTCKLKSIYHIDYPESVTKTAIFFNDPYWLNFQLSEDSERGHIKKNGYEYNLQERIENAGATASAPTPPEETWQDEDGFEFQSEESEKEVPVSEDQQELLTQQAETTEQEAEKEQLSTDETPAEAEKINFPQLQVPETVANTEELIPIEPYHTVDYFASQGIKLSQSFDRDELGSKVKSFTAWLRTMKKLQPEEQISRPKENGGYHLQKSEPTPTVEVITEAMAEVYLKQGLTDKAIEVYHKLSLQNPANKHIFAAKISLIKENNL